MVATPTQFGAIAPAETANTAWGTAPLPDGPLFGTDGIRGRAGELLTAPLALAIGFWAGKTLAADGRTGPVVLGQDSRNSSDMLAMSLVAGLTSAGLEVWNVGLCPTPCVAHLTAASEAIAGIMISASHNPPADNGIKVFGADGMKLAAELAEQIETGIRRGSAPSQVAWGKFRPQPQLTDRYAESLRAGLPAATDFTGMKVVLDLAWGAAVDLAPQLFRELGAEVICLHGRADGDRINVGCGSTCMRLLQAAVQGHRADLGFAFDGDADRVLAVDERGRVLDGDRILYFWGSALQAERRLPEDLLVATVMANLGFERAWAARGGRLLRTQVGDKYVQEQMWRSGAMLGGEQSGHVICRHYGHSGDGLQTALHVTRLAQGEATLGEWRDASFEPYPQILENVRVEDAQRRRNWQDCEPVVQAIARARADLGDAGRVLVRASGTEPVLRIMVEAESERATRHWTEQLVQVAQQYLG